MIRSFRAFRYMTAIAATALSFGVVCAPASANDQVHLRLDWSWHVLQVPFLLAQEKGYYKDAGLDVTIDQGQGSKTTTLLVGQEESPIGHVNISTAAQSISAGVPIKAVATIAQKGPTGLICDAGKPLAKPDDLKGRKIGSTPSGSDAQIFPAFLAKNGLQMSDVQLVNMQGDAKFAALMSGQVDCISGDIPYYAPQAEEKGKKVSSILYADWGVPNLAYGIIANNDFIKSNPDVVRRFVGASLKAVQYAYDHIDESVDFFMAKTGNTLSRDYNIKLMSYYKNSFHTKNTEGKPLGWMAEQDWKDMLEALGHPDGKPASDYFTNDFIPKE